jgi:alpha-ketoglutarate-dependent taurine dioxygenase
MNLPDNQTIDGTTLLKLEKQREYGECYFPLALSFELLNFSEACEWLSFHAELLNSRTIKHGAILLRGLPLESPVDFDGAIQAIGFENFTYENSLSNAVRVVHSSRVFSANEAPADTTIFLHHEMAQTPQFPSKLFFFCQKAPDKGGSTPICRSDHLWELIQEELPKFSENCRKRGLKYTNIMPAEADLNSGMGRSWQSTLSVHSSEQAETRLSKLGYTWEWLENNELKVTTPVLPSVRKLSDGRYSFFNQLIAAFKGWKDTRNDPSRSITFGDDSIINPYDISKISDLADTITFDLPWEDGDLAIIDNFLCMHGRRSYTGTRKVLASLVA